MDKMPGEVRPAGETPVAPGAPSVSPAPIILGMYDLGEYQVYEMIGAKLAAAFDVFVKLSLPEGPWREPPAQSNPQKARDGAPIQAIEPGGRHPPARPQGPALGETLKMCQSARESTSCLDPWTHVIRRSATKKKGVSGCSANPLNALGSPNGVRTRVFGVRGRYPRPLDDGTLDGWGTRIRT